MRWTTLILCLCTCYYLPAQDYIRLGSPIQIATSDNGIALQGVRALSGHSACLMSGVAGWGVQLSGYNRYQTDLTNVNIGMSWHGTHQGVGVTLSRYGIDGLSQHLLSGHFMRRLSSRSILAISGHLTQWLAEGRETTTRGDLSLNLAQDLSGHVSISLLIDNALDLFSDDDRGTGRLDLSAGIQVSEELQLYTSISTDRSGRVGLRPGIRYQPHDILTVYASTSTSPALMSAGLSVNVVDRLDLDIAYSNQNQLGGVLAVGFGYRW